MTRRKRRHLDEDSGLDLTSLLDVIFNLVFFFVLATNIRTEESFLDITLPQVSETARAAEPVPLPEIYVTKGGAYSLNGMSVTAEQLLAQLTEMVQRDKVERAIVSADAAATVQQSVDAMEIVHKAGIGKVAQRVKKQ